MALARRLLGVWNDFDARRMRDMAMARQQEQDKRQQQEDEFKRLALMATLSEKGVGTEAEMPTIKATLPDVGTIGGAMPRRQSTTVDTTLRDPTQSTRLGTFGGQEYFRSRAQEIAAQRKASEKARLDAALTQARTKRENAEAAKATRPASVKGADVRPRRQYDAMRGQVIDLDTGEATSPRGISDRPDGSRASFIRTRMIHYMTPRREESVAGSGLYRSVPGLSREDARRQAQMDADEAYGSPSPAPAEKLKPSMLSPDSITANPFAGVQSDGEPKEATQPYKNADEARADYDQAASVLRAAGKDDKYITDILGARP